MSSKTDPVVLARAQELLRADEYKACLAFIDENESELGADADYLRAEIYSSAEKVLHGLGRKPRKALEYYKKAAAQGHADASYELGRMFARGDGTKEDLDAAVTHLRSAAAVGHDLAPWALANLLYENPARSDATDALALFEQLSADETLGGSALLKLGRIYTRGLCRVAEDPVRAIEYLERSAKLGNTNALSDLAYAYFRGKGVERNLARAKEYIERVGKDHMLYDEIMALLNAPEA